MRNIKALPYRYRVVILIFFLILITYLDRICISLVGVRIKKDFDLSNEQFGWVLGAFALAYALFEIPSALMGDRIGQRKVFIRIVLWWSFFTALTGFTTGLISLIIVRFLFGVGEAGAYPNSTGAISNWLPARERARGISWMNLGASAGSAIAPLIVVPIAVHYGWRASFVVNGFIGIVWVIVCYSWFRNQPSQMKGISNEEKEFIEKNRSLSSHSSFSLAAAFKKRTMWALSIGFYCSQWANYFFIGWMAVYLQEGKKFSEDAMKNWTSFLFVFGIVAALISGFAGDWLVAKKGLKFGRRFIGMLSFAMMGISMLINAYTADPMLVVITLAIARFFYGANAITFYSTCIDIGGAKATSVAGIMNFFGQMGAFFMAILFGKIVDISHSFNTPIYLLAGVSLVGCLLWMFIDAGKPLLASKESVTK